MWITVLCLGKRTSVLKKIRTGIFRGKEPSCLQVLNDSEMENDQACVVNIWGI